MAEKQIATTACIYNSAISKAAEETGAILPEGNRDEGTWTYNNETDKIYQVYHEKAEESLKIQIRKVVA